MSDHKQEQGSVEILLRHGNREAVVSSLGASLRGYLVDGEEVVTRYAGAASVESLQPGEPTQRTAEEAGTKMGGQGDVLIPFPGRIANGEYSFNGKSYQLARNDHNGPNAIHGFLRMQTWEIENTTAESAQFTAMIKADEYAARGYPFTIRSAVSYRVDENGLTCSFRMTNEGDGPAPVAAGFHPYFTVGTRLINDNQLQVPLSSTLEFENLIPTGKEIPVDGTPFDFRSLRAVGDTVIDNCWVNPTRDADRLLRVHLRAAGGHGLTVWMDASCNYVVIYSGDPLPEGLRRHTLAIEPMTCGSDGFNHPEWGLVSLAPGESLTGSWGVETSR